jgi:nucleoside-diphosphate-sugar epimerase
VPVCNPLAADLDHILAHAPWDDLREARLFVTGGTGFVGCWLLESFAWANERLQLGASMTVLTRSPEAFRAKAPHLAANRAIELLAGDVRSFAFPEDRFTHAIHGATQASAALSREQPLPMLDTIVDGTRRTLDCAFATGVRRFLLISSGAVYGTQPPEIARFSEDLPGGPDATDPRSVYAEGKRLAELTTVLYARRFGLRCPIARCFAFVGPYLPLDAHFAIGNFIGDALHGKPIAMHGDGTPCRSYLYAADLAIWLWTILLRGESCRPYNVGSEFGLNIAQLAARVAATLGVRAPSPAAPSPHMPERYIPDTTRAQRELGLRQHIGLDDAIRRTASWHIAQSPIYEEAHA